MREVARPETRVLQVERSMSQVGARAVVSAVEPRREMVSQESEF